MQHVREAHVSDEDREGLTTTTLGLEFRLESLHFKKGDLKIKCLAMIATVYWKSNELSIEGERPLKMPVMESRETRAQGHTHAEHILGKKRKGERKGGRRKGRGGREGLGEGPRVDDATMTRAERHSAVFQFE